MYITYLPSLDWVHKKHAASEKYSAFYKLFSHTPRNFSAEPCAALVTIFIITVIITTLQMWKTKCNIIPGQISQHD